MGMKYKEPGGPRQNKKLKKTPSDASFSSAEGNGTCIIPAKKILSSSISEDS
ncbi:hypothetical protein COCNU_03G004710 [Cocos nucifera]|uniref:Uncharacterized protein n=1 Tax=Cocos nucifera TaxID=13894 RepID=A0A8K0I1Y0_COCNU|nr:hypothetical protein COCNU_03G004710 [Cocos nucifera]